MRDFSWKYFAITGDIDAYLLYKEICGCRDNGDMEEEQTRLEEVAES